MANNTLNVLYKEDADYALEFPIVSDYAVFSSLYPTKKNADIQKMISEYIEKITNEQKNSREVEQITELKESNERFY